MTQRKAVLLLVILTVGLGPTLAQASSPAMMSSLAGQIHEADGTTPISGANVLAYDLDSEQVYTSEPTGAEGRYELGSLPHGYYEVGVKTEGGLFLANNVVHLPAAAQRTVSMNVAAGTDTAAVGTMTSGTVGNYSFGSWLAGMFSSPLTGAAIVVGSIGLTALAVQQVTDDDDSPSISPFSP